LRLVSVKDFIDGIDTAMKSLIKARKAPNNYRGWRTSRKIVVIESDDWGSICMPSARVYEKLVQQNYRIDLCPYATNDSLASEEDLKKLFSTLSEFRDNKGNNPVITANTVMTNPDFTKIRTPDSQTITMSYSLKL
jgi:hypothetical protein